MRFLLQLPLRTQKIIATVVAALLNALLLWQFFPTRWPYLWPSPAVPIILGSILVLVWLRQQGYWTKTLAIRVAGVLLLFLSEAYAWHTLTIAWAHPTLVAILQAITVLWISGVIALGVLNQLWPRDNQVAPPLPAELPEVAAVIPTYGEPIAVLEPVLQSLLALDYPRDKLQIYISDDGQRAEVQ